MINQLPTYSVGRNYKHSPLDQDKTGLSAYTSLIKHCIGSQTIGIGQEEEIKGI